MSRSSKTQRPLWLESPQVIWPSSALGAQTDTFSRRPWYSEEVTGKENYGQIIQPAAFLAQSFPGYRAAGMRIRTSS